MRTALVLAGTGTAGAYHAGVLRALEEAGVRLDVVAGRGIGAVGAVFAAIDASHRLWEEDGLWGPGPASRQLYPWRRSWRLTLVALAASALTLLAPIVVLLVGAILYPVGLLLQLVVPAVGEVATAAYMEVLGQLTDPVWLSVVIPRVVTSILLVLLAVLMGSSLWLAWRAPRRARGPLLWRVLGTPFEAATAADWCAAGVWRYLRGASAAARPGSTELSRRYAELLAEGLGQPGHRELVLAAHDVDVRRDVVLALLRPPHREHFFGAQVEAGDTRRAWELVDLAGAGRDHLMDAVAGALSVPFLAGPRALRFAPESVWQGESHRLQDRPAATLRLLEELSAAGVEQVIVVSGASCAGAPHGLQRARLDPRGWLGEYLSGVEVAAVRDAVTALFDRFSGVFTIEPEHNALGPFDFSGTYDERSDRRVALRELIARGYEDAYRQFVEPVVGGPEEAAPGGPSDVPQGARAGEGGTTGARLS